MYKVNFSQYANKPRPIVFNSKLMKPLLTSAHENKAFLNPNPFPQTQRHKVATKKRNYKPILASIFVINFCSKLYYQLTDVIFDC